MKSSEDRLQDQIIQLLYDHFDSIGLNRAPTGKELTVVLHRLVDGIAVVVGARFLLVDAEEPCILAIHFDRRPVHQLGATCPVCDAT